MTKLFTVKQLKVSGSLKVVKNYNAVGSEMEMIVDVHDELQIDKIHKTIKHKIDQLLLEDVNDKLDNMLP